MQVILLDIEGTTTPVNFVYGTLFPYARKHLREFLTAGLGKEDLGQLEAEYQHDSSPIKPTRWAPVEYLYWLMDQDRKSPALKSIQGKIWKAGFETGLLKGEFFSDVIPAMKRWKAEGMRICIYSSGSVLAQQLIFRYSYEGDISGLIDSYFDTGIGPKKEAESYRAIAQKLQEVPEKILFISDSAAECTAAVNAGCSVRYSVRPGNKVEVVSFEQITTFEGIENA